MMITFKIMLLQAGNVNKIIIFFMHLRYLKSESMQWQISIFNRMSLGYIVKI
jgi:hypothetical protein